MKKYFILIVSILIVSFSVGCPFTTPGAMSHYIANYPEWLKEIKMSDPFSGNDIKDCFMYYDSYLENDKYYNFSFNYESLLPFDLVQDNNRIITVFCIPSKAVYDIKDAPVYIKITDPNIFEYDGYIYDVSTHVRFEKTDDGFNVYFSNENGNAGPIHFTRK